MDYREIAEEFCRIQIINTRKMEKIEKFLPARGEANILLSLVHSDRELLAGELAKSCGLSVSRVTNILNSLEKKKLIVKRSDDWDKRKVYISLTDAGRAFIMERHGKVVSGYERVFRRLGEEDSQEYVRLIKKFSTIMEEEIEREIMQEMIERQKQN